MLTKIYSDDEIIGRIYLQVMNLFATTLLHNKKDLFFDHAFSTMHKLSATKYHLNNYERIEKEQYEQAKRSFKRDKYVMREAFGLIFELEAFLFQIKSSLDMLVKLMIPIIGENMVQTFTYGKSGENLIKGLSQYKNKSGVNSNAVDALMDLIKSDKDSWLKSIVDIRDELNHKKGLKNYKFEPVQLPNGQIVVKKPSFKNMNTLSFMNTAYSNNIEFHQDFMAFSLAIIAPPNFTIIIQDTEEAVKTYNHKAAQYIKWAWGYMGKD